MASHVAPGYNPEVSLLQGGTAPILPVQGGGSMIVGAGPPAGFNPTDSLLERNIASPNTIPIHGVSGGGHQEGGAEKAYANYVIEQYDPELSMIDIPALPVDKKTQRDLLDAYQKASDPLLFEVVGLDRAPVRYLGRFIPPEDNYTPVYAKCSKGQKPPNFFQTVRKRVVLIDTPEPFIWVVPNLKGNLAVFLQYMKLIPRAPDGTILPNHYVVFTDTFFADPSKRLENQNLYHQFLLEKTKNMKNLYYLNDLTDDFMNVACSIVSNLYEASYLVGRDGKQKMLTTFFEPDFLVFLGPKLLFKNSELPLQRDNPAIKLSTLLQRPAFVEKYKSFILVPARGKPYDYLAPNSLSNSDKSKGVVDDQRYFTFSFQDIVTKSIPFPSKSEILCPKDKKCQNFQGGYRLASLADERNLDTPGGTSVLYLLYVNKDKMPFLKEEGSTLTPEELASLTATPVPVPVSVSVSVTAPLTAPGAIQPAKKTTLIAAPVLPTKTPLEESFTPYAEAVKANTREIDVNVQKFLLRIPYEKGVRDDWEAGHFLEEECNLLNTLQFTPTLLAEALGKSMWKIRLADFLESLVESNCFENTKLMTKRECSNSQEFIKQIHFTLFNRRLFELYDATGTPKPETFSDLLQMLKTLQILGPTTGTATGTGMLNIHKNQYTGDLLERFQVLKFNSQSGEYYTDFADMTEETRKVLERMKLYRVKSMNMDAITKELMTRLGVPIPINSGALSIKLPSTPPPTPVSVSGSTPLPPPTPPSSPVSTAAVSIGSSPSISAASTPGSSPVISAASTPLASPVISAASTPLASPVISAASTPLASPVISAASTPALVTPISKAAIVASCPIVNKSNWCFVNASIQLLNDIPELRDGFNAVTDKEIKDSTILYTSEHTPEKVKSMITIYKIIMNAIRDNTSGTALDFENTVKTPTGTSIYRAMIDTIQSEVDKRYIKYRNAAIQKKELYTSKKIPFEYGKQSDADEFILVCFGLLFDSSLLFLRKSKYSLLYESYESIQCKDPAIGTIRTGETLLYSFDMKAINGQDRTGNFTYVKSIQEGIDFTQEKETLTAPDNQLERCAKGKNAKGIAETKSTQYKIFPFTKYLFVKVSRLGYDGYYKGSIEINKRLTINGVEFQPRGVICHDGHMNKTTGETGGHYTYYHYENGDPKVFCNDDSITDVTNVQDVTKIINVDARVVLYERIGAAQTVLINQILPIESKILSDNKGSFDAALALTNGTERGNARTEATRRINQELIKQLEGLSTPVTVVVGGSSEEEILDMGEPLRSERYTRKKRKHSKRLTRRDVNNPRSRARL